jgi:hypothetical protein
MSAEIKWWNIKTYADCQKMIGKLVYELYSPAKCGKIVDCWIHKGSYRTQTAATIHWLKDGSKSNRGLIGMGDLELLVENHKRKIKTHEKRIKELKKL